MRNMSFMLTTEQMYNETKTVTRRLGWSFLKAGDLVMACVKCQGLGKGGKIERIHPIEIISNTPEWLGYIGVEPIREPFLETEAMREGFMEMTGWQFLLMFCKEMKCDPTTLVNRIEFKHQTHKQKG